MVTLARPPVFIVYDTAVADETGLAREVERTLSSPGGTSGGTPWNATLYQAARRTQAVPRPHSCGPDMQSEIDLAGAFRSICGELRREPCPRPEVLVLFGTKPATGWIDARRELSLLSVNLCAVWLAPRLPADAERREIELLLQGLAGAEHAPCTRIVLTRSRSDAIPTTVLRELRDRLLRRDRPEATPGIGVVPPLGASAGPPPVRPAGWEEREPDASLGDRTAHHHTDFKVGVDGWSLFGASRRGRLHAHEGTFREDAFVLGAAGGWQLAAVADGAGSHRLSRIGSNQAVKEAMATMTSRLGEATTAEAARAVLLEALQDAWQRLRREADSRRVDLKDLGTTLLLLAHNPECRRVAVAQVGDGLLAAQNEDGSLQLLGKPETGEYSGQTQFLTHCRPDELDLKIEVVEVVQPVLFLVMTDGVADDFDPPLERLPKLIEPLATIIAQEDPRDALLRLLNYERAGSFDDRTLVVLCRAGVPASPAPLPSTPSEGA